MNRIHQLALVSGALLGLLAIVLGAMGAHALKSFFSAEGLESFKTGVMYQQYTAFFFLILPLLGKHFDFSIKATYWLGVLGITLFSGSIYFLSFNSEVWQMNLPKFVFLTTPLGGTLLIASWVVLLVQLLRRKFQ